MILMGHGFSRSWTFTMNNQLEIHLDSRFITIYSTHVGLRRHKRLNFGINAASEIFQQGVQQVINGIPVSKNISDDIIIYDYNDESHDQSLEQVLQSYRRTSPWTGSSANSAKLPLISKNSCSLLMACPHTLTRIHHQGRTSKIAIQGKKSPGISKLRWPFYTKLCRYH